MSYTVLARRYRSQSFDEVVGQEAIARTLQRAIEQDRVAHAYLFVGTRGVGKTSMARLLAKALNGGLPEVDQAIMTGQDTDVIEIDAASNRSVDEARDLIANCVYRPMRGEYKVYIIDEVHMLTREAFNALLKTMEEPPSHVKFILCTTEPHKVPPTIQSRCQRFDFGNISTDAIAGHLQNVLDTEGMTAEPELVRMVARMASGSMRDGLSLLDRVMAAAPSGETMTVALLEKLLGLPERDVLFELVDAIVQQDVRTALDRSDAMLTRGVSMEQAIDSIVATLRDLMVLAACDGETDLVDMSGAARERAAAIALKASAPGLIHMISTCESVSRMTKSSSNPRALFDAMIVRLAMTEQIADVATLLKGAPAGARPSAAPQKKSASPPVSRPAQPTQSAAAPPPKPAAAPRPAPTAAAGDDVWSKVCAAASAKTTTRVLVQSLQPVEVAGNRAVLKASDSRQLAYAKSKVDQLAALFKEAVGSPVEIVFQDDASPTNGGAQSSSIVNDPILEHELVRKAISLFDAKVVAIEKEPPGGS